MPPLSPKNRGEASPVKTPARFAQSSPGFALLITITLLAFLVLLLVSLATLTKVETQVATNNQDVSQARQNALMALNIAIGQLQKYTGPDQRVTATADLASRDTSGTAANDGDTASNITNSDGSQVSIHVGTRLWTGSWLNLRKPIDSYISNPTPTLLSWLVSGNEITASKYTPSINIPASVSDPLTPVSVGSGNQVILLVGAKSIGTITGNIAGTPPTGQTIGPANISTSDRYVVAPLVPLKAIVPGSGSDSVIIGRYAWWVGDEGVKAKISIADPNASVHADTTTASSTGVLARNRFRVAARTAPETLTEFKDFPAPPSPSGTSADDMAYVQVPNINQPEQAVMIKTKSGALALSSSAQAQHFHDFTTHSYGVLSDTLRGGLRRDLTWEFEAPDVDFKNAPLSLKDQPIIPSGSFGAGVLDGPWPRFYAGLAAHSIWTTTPPSANTTNDTRFRWDALRNWYQLANTPLLIPQPATPWQTNIAPTLISIRLAVSVRLDQNTNTLCLRIIPAFIIANPYAHDMTFPRGMYISITPNNNDIIAVSAYSSPSNTGLINYPLIQSNGASATKPVLSLIYFRIAPGTVLPAGEARIFGVKNPMLDFKIASAPPTLNNPTTPVDLSILDTIITQQNYIEYNTNVAFSPPPTDTIINTSRSANKSICIYTYEPDTYSDTYSSSAFWPTGSRWYSSANFSLPQRLSQVLGEMDLGNPTQAGTTTKSNLTATDSIGTPTAVPVMVMNVDMLMTENKNPATINSNIAAYALAKDYNIRGSTLYRTGTDGFAFYPGGGMNAAALFNAFIPATVGTWQDLLSTGLGSVSPTWSRCYDMLNGSSKLELFDTPQRSTPSEMPMVSLGEFQHASLTADDEYLGVGDQPGNAFGNSYFNPKVPRENSFITVVASPLYRAYDISYLYNTALWDSFFFSTVPSKTMLNDGQSIPGTLANPRLNPIGDSEVSSFRTNGFSAASRLMIDGAFNVNSTSISAWKAVLSANRGLIYYTSAGADTPANAATPYPHTLHQSSKFVPISSSADVSQTEYTSGYRALSDDQIGALAQELVKQVRMRGPFVSLAQFINRKLAPITDPTMLSRSGALQSAIDNSGINSITQSTESANYLTASAWTGLGMDAHKLFLGLNDAQKTHISNNRSVGMPGWLTQADIFQSLGPVLSARSDTFVIRVYGETLDPLTSTDNNPVIKARAWCEATVQRYPDYVDSSDTAADIVQGSHDNAKSVMDTNGISTGLSPINQKFGRRYRIVSFRWLTANDI
ncbi:MAG TPA: hypothetical protein VL357_10225 [Rariglobus sp.]|jgi:hypothetical protein|nr:hypothetical protein [Rariglobus sp.]